MFAVVNTFNTHGMFVTSLHRKPEKAREAIERAKTSLGHCYAGYLVTLDLSKLVAPSRWKYGDYVSDEDLTKAALKT